ncbi:low molecular weight protein-tyrosine-phosphatase [Reinekea blandensis]|uniref:protein-tyrosine-phosphatase n=1 Tax=Reinekea blandensis MED297 TaxID=314283 RepID=A4BE05_9GAMM|nr:low molecular weight protein-tyrosine-phosphatase [Reinekea blandensis]EAR09764.1 Protein tyrosine phosphatase [Reinekea blandensis MED297]
MKLLFVCLGNICRSPTAHGVMVKQLADARIDFVEVDSAGTAAYHIGNPPDSRTQAAAERRGYDLSGLRARQVTPEDFYEFDYIFAMDESNLNDLQQLQPEESKARLLLALAFSAERGSTVPDPYYGGEKGFDDVLDLCETLSQDIIKSIVRVETP